MHFFSKYFKACSTGEHAFFLLGRLEYETIEKENF
jgi:hypothetical protein